MIWKPSWFSLGKNKKRKLKNPITKNKKNVIFQLPQFSIYPTNPWNICKRILRIGGSGKWRFVFCYWGFQKNLFFSIKITAVHRGFHMRHHLFLYYGWFLQNLEKGFIRTNMHMTVVCTHTLFFQENVDNLYYWTVMLSKKKILRSDQHEGRWTFHLIS